MSIANTLGPLLPGLVGGGAAGYVVGWGVKKLFKIILTVVGVISALVFSVIYWLEYKGVLKVSIDFAKFYALVSGITTTALHHAERAASFAMMLNTGFVGFAAGALLGWRRA